MCLDDRGTILSIALVSHASKLRVVRFRPLSFPIAGSTAIRAVVKVSGVTLAHLLDREGGGVWVKGEIEVNGKKKRPKSGRSKLV